MEDEFVLVDLDCASLYMEVYSLSSELNAISFRKQNAEWEDFDIDLNSYINEVCPESDDFIKFIEDTWNE